MCVYTLIYGHKYILYIIHKHYICIICMYMLIYVYIYYMY